MAKRKSKKKVAVKASHSSSVSNTKSCKRSRKKKGVAKKKEPQISYKESHSIGRRQSTNVPTYNESGRLYYDLYVKYGLNQSFSGKEARGSRDSSHNGGFRSDASDTSTVACNEAATYSLRKISRMPKQIIKSDASSRREASLNAEAKVNMLFESTKDIKSKRKPASSPNPTETKAKQSKLTIEDAEYRSPRKRVSRSSDLVIFDPSSSKSSPNKRLAGLNAMAIISAFMKPPRPSSSTDQKPRQRRSKKVVSLPCTLDTSITADGQSGTVIPTSSPPSSVNPPDPLTTVAVVTDDSKQDLPSVVPTVERFQSQKFISYGPKCIGVENISRQIIRVPSQNRALPGPSVSSSVSQHFFTPPRASSPSHAFSSVLLPTASTSSPQSHSMIVLPDTSFNSQSPRPEFFLPTDFPPYFPGQFYVSPFGHLPVLQPHAFFMSPTVIHSMSPSPFHFLQTSPFTAAYIQSPAPLPANYMLPMPISPVYNTFPTCTFGSCVVPRPMFQAQQISAPPPSHATAPITLQQPMPVTHESVASQAFGAATYEAPNRIDRAVSPIPEVRDKSPPSPVGVTSIKKAPTKRNSVDKKQTSCLWVWEGTPVERLVFVKVRCCCCLQGCLLFLSFANGCFFQRVTKFLQL